MEFCDECGSMMHGEDGSWICRSCGFEKAKGDDESD
ncbi:MAG: DNA-directed RNA polymerase subunit M, partial [Natronomonas sp.]